METCTPGVVHPRKLWLALVGIAFMMLAVSFPALAALGGDVNSVQEDQAHMKGSLQIHPAAAYSVHEITTSTRTVVREYVSPEGKVFGVAWQGPFVPDMQQLLGTSFQQYSAAVQANRDTHARRKPLNIQEPGLVVQTSGHVRAYSGRAYIPEMVPQGVSAETIR